MLEVESNGTTDDKVGGDAFHNPNRTPAWRRVDDPASAEVDDGIANQKNTNANRYGYT
jgi:hypothetical protein